MLDEARQRELRTDFRSGPAVAVWGLWALMVLAALLYAAAYGSNVPRWDDFLIVPYVTLTELVTTGWFWEQFNEHRIALPKLVMLALLALTGDFRAAMIFNVLTMAAAACALIVCTRRLRGRTSYVDGLFPLVLLSWAQSEAFLWNFTVQLTLSVSLATAVLILIAGRKRWAGGGTFALAAAGLGLLALSGGQGILFLPPLAVWLGAAGLFQVRAQDAPKRKAGTGLLALTLFCMVLVGAYFFGYARPRHVPAGGQLWVALRTAAQFASMCFGHAAWPLWPFSAAAVVGAVTLGAGAAGVAFWKRPDERFRAAGLLFFLAALASLAGGVGFGRSGYDDYFAGFQSRYATLAVLLLCWSALVWQLYLPPVWAAAAGTGLLLVSGISLVLNYPDAVEFARVRQARLEAVEEDVLAGLPPYRIVARHTPFLAPTHEGMPEVLLRLRDAGVGVFVELADDPPMTESPVRQPPRQAHHMSPTNGAWQTDGAEAFLEFELRRPRRVAGIRLTYSHANDQGASPVWQLAWKRTPEEDYGDKRSFVDWLRPTGDGPFTVTFWLGETVSRFRLRPDVKPCVFKLHSVVLLAEAEGAKRSPSR